MTSAPDDRLQRAALCVALATFAPELVGAWIVGVSSDALLPVRLSAGVAVFIGVQAALLRWTALGSWARLARVRRAVRTAVRMRVASALCIVGLAVDYACVAICVGSIETLFDNIGPVRLPLVQRWGPVVVMFLVCVLLYAALLSVAALILWQQGPSAEDADDRQDGRGFEPIIARETKTHA